ncbi:hypothetical protein [Parachitinimonas caeni]|uniref:Uncharacterized protein n=1 Tax=Parachitinimonas caeni TaxID=3031301 RepID=A0ABT7E0I0_9NEIS|nr:hypothetical protein [Parachitinimonas caeni]MDK2125786.1 hypothetical protein [Parachitinimonas caeni]
MSQGAVRVLSLLFCVIGYVLAYTFFKQSLFPLVALFVLIGTAYGYAFFFSENSFYSQNELFGWIRTNAQKLADGKVLEFNGMPVNRDTQLVVFHACSSFIASSVMLDVPCQLDPKPQEQSRVRAKAIAVSVLTGIWGIKGVMWTREAISKNLRGGTKVSVGTLAKRLMASNKPAEAKGSPKTRKAEKG